MADRHARPPPTSFLADTPDLLPPLAPPPRTHAASYHHHQQQQQQQQRQHSAHDTHDDEDVTSTTTTHSSGATRAHDDGGGAPASALEPPRTPRRSPLPMPMPMPNLTTEADEERLFLQGDFRPRRRPSEKRSRQRRRGRPGKGQDAVPASPPPAPPPAAARGIRERVLHFTPSWFAVTMGTGVIATLLNLLPWPSIHKGLRYPAAVWLVADIIIFLTFSAAFLARYVLFPQVLPLTIKHPQKSMFLGTFPMGLIVIISNIAQLGTVEFSLGLGPALAASGLWWVAVALSLLTAVGVPFVVTTYQSHSFSSTTAALLLPIVPPITAAATGSVIAEAIMDTYPTYAFTIVVVSYMVLGVGLPLALLILVLYFQRLLLFKQPPREVIISVFLPLGPCGQGGEALLHLGQVAYSLFPVMSTRPGNGVPSLSLPVGQALFSAGLLGALLLWALGIWWLALALLTLARELRRGRLAFNMGWWGATFPLGSLAICTARLALVLDSLALKVLYTALVLLTLGVWCVVAVPTARGFADGSLLSRKAAPCIADLPLDPLRRGRGDGEEGSSARSARSDRSEGSEGSDAEGDESLTQGESRSGSGSGSGSGRTAAPPSAPLSATATDAPAEAETGT